MAHDDPHRPANGGSATSPTSYRSNGPWIIGALVVVLLILHQDNWFWNDDTLVFGFMPIGLLWHALISIGASLTWALATKIAWPLSDDAAIEPVERSVEGEGAQS